MKNLLVRLRAWRTRRRNAEAEEIAGMSAADRRAMHAGGDRATSHRRQDGNHPGP